MSRKVALVTAREALALDEDMPPLRDALEALGADVTTPAWDDPDVLDVLREGAIAIFHAAQCGDEITPRQERVAKSVMEHFVAPREPNQPSVIIHVSAREIEEAKRKAGLMGKTSTLRALPLSRETADEPETSPDSTA